MCCVGQCMCCISHKIGSLIFGYISAILSAAGTLLCTVLILYSITIATFNGYQEGYFHTVIVATFYLVQFATGFVCSVLLLVGITKDKPSFIKTYVIYGMIQSVELMIYFIIVHCVVNFFYSGYLLLVAAILGLYGLCLYMIFLTYKSMSLQRGDVNPPVERLSA